MITRDGHAKILDFGLAKLIEQQPMPASDSGEARSEPRFKEMLKRMHLPQ